MNRSDTLALVSEISMKDWRDVLTSALDSNVPAHTLGLPFEALQKLEAEARGSRLPAADGVRLIKIGLLAEFPHDRRDAFSPGPQILGWLWPFRHPSFVDSVAEHYPNSPCFWRQKCALTLLACQRSEHAARAIAAIVSTHGFPASVDFRFFWELNDYPECAAILLPTLLVHAGGELPGVMNFVNIACEKGLINTTHLAPALPVLLGHLEPLMRQAQDMQQSSGSRWRFEERYTSVAQSLGPLLDSLSLFSDAPIGALRQALAFNDPHLQMIAAISLLARGENVPPHVWESVAASDGERADLFRILNARGRVELFPAQFARFEAFAASEMVQWLRYPSELGHEPDAIELAATLIGETEEGPRRWCLWKVADEGNSFAAVSGPYELELPVGPVQGGDTFSTFAEWESATPEEHLQSVCETLEQWRIAHCA